LRSSRITRNKRTHIPLCSLLALLIASCFIVGSRDPEFIRALEFSLKLHIVEGDIKPEYYALTARC